MLAQQGLLGNSRGTWTGTAEGRLAGGHRVPDGSPLGALIAALLVSALVSRDDSRRQVAAEEAHDDIKSIYGCRYSAEQWHDQAGGPDRAVAVRRPDRGCGAVAERPQLVMLYSEATARRCRCRPRRLLGEPRRAGGKLYQQASYQDGQAHAYASNIPTLGASRPEPIPLPVAQHGWRHRLHVPFVEHQRNDAANFMTGQFVTPQFVTEPGDGGAVFELRTHAAIGQHAATRT